MALLLKKKHIINSRGEEELLNIYTTKTEAVDTGKPCKVIQVEVDGEVITGYIGCTDELDTPKASSKRVMIDGKEYAERKYMGTTNFYGWLKTNYPSNYTTITEINLSDTSDGTNFEQMFAFGSRLTTINNLDTRNGANFRDMFFGCSSFTEQPNVDTSKATSVQSMFNECSKMTEFKFINTSNSITFESLYKNCYSSITFPNIDTAKGTKFKHMYYGCSLATYVSVIDFSQATNEELAGIDATQMFTNCSSLRSIVFNNLPIGTTEATLRSKCGIPDTVTEIIMNFREE